MKLKMSILAGAVALASAGQVFAAGSTDLFLTVNDTTNGQIYTRDLGVTSSSFQSHVTGSGATLTASGVGSQSFAADANLISFLTAAGASDVINWNVTGQITGALGPNTEAVIATSTATAFPTTQLNSSIGNATGSLTTYYGNSVPYQTGGLLSGSTAATSVLLNGYVANNGLKVTTTNAIGSHMDMFYITPSSGSGIGKANGVLFGGAANADIWTLNSTGALSVASVAAVPEPGEWLLMLSGLSLIGFIATRRKNQGSALNFA